MFNFKAIALCGGAVAALVATPALAQTPTQAPQATTQQQAVAGTPAGQPGIWQRPQLTGDWGGRRTALQERGVVITANEVIDAGYNFNGGTDSDFRAAGQLFLGANIDTQRLWGWNNGHLQVSLIHRQGNSLSNDQQLGLLHPVQTIYGRGTRWRLAQFWYEHAFNGGATMVKVGRITHGEDFGATPCGNVNLLHLCGPASSQIVGTYLYNMPVSSWGARLRQRFTPEVHLNVGVLESNPTNLRLDRGFYLGTDGGTGVIYSAELQWTPRFGANDELPGTYKIGTWYDTSNSNNTVFDINGDYQALTGLPFAREDHHAGWHANLQQTLIAPEADGSGALTVVGNLAVADEATNRTRSKAAVIFSYTGVFPDRPRDDVTFGVGAVSVSGAVTDQQEALIDAGLRTIAAQETEVGVELNYGYRLTPAITVRPGFQYIHNPGGRDDVDDISLASLKLVLNF